MAEHDTKGKIFVAYHKPFVMLDRDFIVPVHAGKSCLKENKDSNSKVKGSPLDDLIGDDTGDNISNRNNEFNECSVLYWAWKNVDFSKMKYVGFFQYRRQFILNDYFDHAKDDFEKTVYKCVHFKTINNSFYKKIDLTEERILDILNDYDCIIPYATDLQAMNISSPYDDWVRKIPGVHVGDLVKLEEVMKEMHPELADKFEEYLNSPKKLMYQIFIAKPTIAKNYCEWLFKILFEIDKKIDTSLYSINGKRTIGYLAEILYGFYFTMLKETAKVKECGITFIDE
jgi:hypothetical protein